MQTFVLFLVFLAPIFGMGASIHRGSASRYFCVEAAEHINAFCSNTSSIMRTYKLRINQLSPQTYEWYLAYLQAIDSKNVEVYGTFLADDCVMQSNNNAPVLGKAAIVQFLSDYWTSFDSLEHDLLNIYGTDSSFVLEALNHYKRNDGQAITIRAVAFSDRNKNGLVTSVRFYTDTTPLFAPIAA